MAQGCPATEVPQGTTLTLLSPTHPEALSHLEKAPISTVDLPEFLQTMLWQPRLVLWKRALLCTGYYGNIAAMLISS